MYWYGVGGSTDSVPQQRYLDLPVFQTGKQTTDSNDPEQENSFWRWLTKLPCTMNEENLPTYTEKFPADAGRNANSQMSCISLPRVRVRLIHGGIADTGESSWQNHQD